MILVHTVFDVTSQELRTKWNVPGTHAQAMADTGLVIVQTSWAIEFPQVLPQT